MAYRRAIAAQLAGADAEIHWLAFERALRPLYGAAWARGARRVLTTRGVPRAGGGIGAWRVEVQNVADAVGDWKPDKEPDPRLQEFDKQAADNAAHERANAVRDMQDQSPGFGRIIAWVPVQGADMRQQVGLRKLVAEALERGLGEDEVGRKLDTLGLGEFITRAEASLGVRLTDARLENVMRTSMRTAQAEAEAEVLKDETVRVFVPLLTWSAINDPPRVRPTHLKMDGYVGTVETFERQGMMGPAGFQCRCSQVPVPFSVAMERGFVDADGKVQQAVIDAHNGARQQLIDSGLFPDPGFR